MNLVTCLRIQFKIGHRAPKLGHGLRRQGSLHANIMLLHRRLMWPYQSIPFKLILIKINI